MLWQAEKIGSFILFLFSSCPYPYTCTDQYVEQGKY